MLVLALVLTVVGVVLVKETAWVSARQIAVLCVLMCKVFQRKALLFLLP